MFTISGLDAAILSAEIKVGNSPKILDNILYPTIDWEDASEEMKKDPTVLWITSHMFNGDRKYTYRERTKEEKKILRLNKVWRLEHMFDYILKNYGWEYAEGFYFHKNWHEKFKKLNITPKLKVPHCKYTYDGSYQCDMFCPFFDCKCTYNAEVLD